jgi:hypothetical protein
MKNILVYTTCELNLTCGGLVVQYELCRILDSMGINVRLHAPKHVPNSIFSKFYNNDLNLKETVVIYGETLEGNPMNARYVVRWILAPLGVVARRDIFNTWGKNDLVYYFNSEEKLANNPDKLGFIYKLLNVLYINPYATNNNLPNRNGTCFTMRKAIGLHGKIPQIVHPPGSLEIKDGTRQIDCINIFNNHKYFISYDSLTFLSVIAALCGCISIVKKIDGLSKQDWLNTQAAAEYLKVSGENMLYGIAYGAEEVEKASNTLHLVKEQWERIVQFSKDKYVASFIQDINDFPNMVNRVHNNF